MKKVDYSCMLLLGLYSYSVTVWKILLNGPEATPYAGGINICVPVIVYASYIIIP